MKIPDYDATPPTATLEVIARDTSLSLGAGEEPDMLPLEPDDSLVLIAVGEDRDGGIKDLSLTGVALVKCRDPGTGRVFSRRTGFMRRHVAGSVPTRKAARRTVSRFVLRPADFVPLCPGAGIAGVTGQASVRALNFHGGQASTPRLEFLLAEAEAADLASRAPPAVTQAIPYPTGSGSGAGSGSFMGGSGPAAACPRTDAPSIPVRPGARVAGPLPAECDEVPVPFVSPRRGSAGPSGHPRYPPLPRGDADATDPKTQSSPLPREPPI